MRFRLRTLLIAGAVGPLVLWFVWWFALGGFVGYVRYMTDPRADVPPPQELTP